MSLQVIPNSNNTQTRMVPKPSVNGVSNGSMVKVYDEQKKAPTKVKLGVFLTTLASVGAATAIALKLKGKLTNPFKTPIKQWGLFNVKYEEKDLTGLVCGVGAASIGGGLLGGAIFDKKGNMKAKYREAVIQAIGNIGTPLLCVAGGMHLFEKHALPKIIEKFALKTDKAKGAPKLIASAVFLLTGIIAGNKVGNYINKKAFRVDDQRKLKLSDMSPHIDDTCLAISIAAPENAIGYVIKRFIPAALMVAGFSTGIAQECPHHHHIEKTNSTEEVKQS